MKALVQVKGILKRMPVQRKASRTTCKQVGSFVRCASRIDDLQNKLEIISLFRSNDFYVTLFCSLHHFKKHSSASLRTNITFAKYEVMSI